MVEQEISVANEMLSRNKNVLIELINVNKSFGNNHVIRNFNFKLHEEENVVILGKSGSGKSVLIKLIIGLLKPDLGKIFVLGDDVAAMNNAELDKMRVRVGFLFQSNALYDSMTVRENLEFPLRRHRKSYDKVAIDKMVEEVLENVGLPETAEKMPSELSGGMKKRIALARTLILKPQIILYDEPTSGLDPITGGEISSLINKVQQQYKTAAIIISHDLKCAKITGNRVVILHNGTCYADGSFDELSNSKDKNVINFFK